MVTDSQLNPDGSLTFSLPIPHRDVSPNARRGESKWAAIAKSKKVKSHRHAALNMALYATRHHKVTTVQWAGYSLAFFFKTAAFRDDDNADGSCKAYRDGIAQALCMDDKKLRKCKLSTHAKDADFPRVEITLYPSPELRATNVATGLVP